ncbi:DUF6624 domain-containing protein [Spirosoma oryzicola]|uniref:DUF6624 domain-containing protein n=1 Tax=Spirosoma oryzicola TaxID=2898794 RepID=UPI001E57022C|nr:DUF6624 domain-containing protein [Spirosoma oryzicola]UHG89594.1 hypothetical protein LQ777_15215 [Spirosoma oryzicola]
MRIHFYATIIGLSLCFGQPSWAQTLYATQDTTYIRAVERALVYLQKGQCEPCLTTYQKAFTIAQKSALSTMRAALCAFQCKQYDLAKFYIQRATDIDYAVAEETWYDQQTAPEFDLVRSSGMKELAEEVFTKKDAQLGLNQALKQQLITIYTTDQQPRSRVDSLIRSYGMNSPQMQQLWQQIHQIDSVNLAKIEQIIKQYGYPGQSLVGSKQGNTAWLVIQHSSLSVQEKYFPLMQQAAKEDEMQKSNLALLTDRIRLAKGQQQLYGTQVISDSTGKKAFGPIEDEANVNKRRAEVGLGPIEEYAKQFGLDYNKSLNR